MWEQTGGGTSYPGNNVFNPGYLTNFLGMNKGNCIPTFDWANKMGDWNVPQFNSFYKYTSAGISSYEGFVNAIGTSWTEANTRFLDDSMWMGAEGDAYKGDIWHPQAPTKSYQELSGMYGYGGDNAQEGQWAHWAGLAGDSVNYRSEFFYWDLGGTIGAEGIHIPSRYDSGIW